MTEIKKDLFYGKELSERHAQHECKVTGSTSTCENDPLPKRRRLFGPSEFWGQYSTQQEALSIANQRSFSSLHTFVYQNDQGYRKFIVAHPEVYWLIDECKPPEQRCSYESDWLLSLGEITNRVLEVIGVSNIIKNFVINQQVIPDGSPCHLYFDLEFSKDLNPSKDGSKMTKILIDVFSAYFLEHWGFPCKRSDVLSLDSTTESKFSRHLIFHVKNVMFKNNKHAGRFVRSICSDIRRSLLNPNLNLDQSSNNEILKKFRREDLEDLFIDTTIGKKFFIDEGVYTKNRHFRIYKSTKWGKNSHLIKSTDSEYVSSSGYKDEDLGTFLDSLISYMPDSRNLVLLEYQDNGEVDAIKYTKECLSQRTWSASSVKIQESDYPDIDKFILDIVCPGKIREVKYSEQKMLIYGIADYRYCANIGRQHKSNGIYWVVDLHTKMAFQKCHDFDCRGFKSMPQKLPEKICFQLDEENDILLASVPEPQELYGKDSKSMPGRVSERVRFQLDEENDMLLASVPEPHDSDDKNFESVSERLTEKIRFQLDDENDMLLASVPDPQDCNATRKMNPDRIVALEDDSLDAELTKIEIDVSLS